MDALKIAYTSPPLLFAAFLCLACTAGLAANKAPAWMVAMAMALTGILIVSLPILVAGVITP